MNTPSLGQIAADLGHAKKSGGGYVCSCPCHDDAHASLSIKERDGKLLFKCHANCDQGVLVAEFRRRGWLNGADLERETKRRIVATFPFVDEAGDLLYEAVRYEPKAFKQRRPDGNGGWVWSLGDTRRVLYRLPELLEDLAAERTIFVVEGERKVDLLRRWNIAATCNSGGAEKWLPEFSELFRAAAAVLLPDNDAPGRKHVEAVAASLAGADARVHVLDLPGLGPKGDILNWAAAGGTADQLLALVESNARPWRNGKTEHFENAEMRGGDVPPNRKKERAAPAICSAKSLKVEVFPPIKSAVKGYLVEGATILAGRPKIGKSWIAMDWGVAIARGGFCFGDIHCQEGNVLYLALEDNKRRLKSRLAKLLGYDAEWPEKFEYATEWPRANEGGIEAIRTWVKSKETPRLVVVDVLEAFRSRPHNGNDNTYALDYGTIKALQGIASEFNIAILIIHHLRKGATDGDPIDKISGTLGLSGGADALLILDRNTTGVTLYGRGRDIEEFDRSVRFNRETCRWEVLGETAEVRISDERASILDVLKSATEAMAPAAIAYEAEIKPGNLRRLLGKMVRAGEVLKGGRSGRGLYAHKDNPDFLPKIKTQRTAKDPPKDLPPVTAVTR